VESKRILVVDDSPTMRQLIVFALRRIKGLIIDEAGDGVEGFKKIRENSFDLLITDINMPIMDGLKLVSLVRNEPSCNGIPIIIISTEGAEKDKQRAFQLGANTYIVKPIQAPVVISKVKEYLSLP
jgi:two-component system, chemotaxis family, chemotaxis protein CheY